MSIKSLFACVVLFSCLLIFPQSGRAITANLEASQDNTLYQTLNGDLSNGAGASFFVGQTLQGFATGTRRALIMFDVAGQLPSTATITSATLNLNVDLAAGSGLADSIELYRVSTAWGEENSFATGGSGGGGAGGPALPGDATWTHSMLGSNTWANLGGDFSQDLSASTFVSGAGSYSWSSSELTADIQDMLLEPQNNFGWILLGNENFPETAKRFTSRESSNPPILTIEYDVPGGGPDPDFDDDGDVDDEDLGDWANAYGGGNGGDADNDGDTDGSDYLAWQNGFTGPAGLQAAAVPEPSSLMLALVTVSLSALNRRRRR